jgi:hypothetical protein
VTFGAVVILLERHLGGNEFQNQTKYLNKYKAEREFFSFLFWFNLFNLCFLILCFLPICFNGGGGW